MVRHALHAAVAAAVLFNASAQADDPAPATDTKQSTGFGGWLKKQTTDFKAGLHDRPVVATGYDASRGQGVCREGDTFPVFSSASQSTARTANVGGTVTLDPNMGTCDALIQSGAFRRVAAGNNASASQGGTVGGTKYVETGASCNHPTLIKTTTWHICHDDNGTQTGLFDRVKGFKELPPGYAIDIKTGEFIKGGDPRQAGVIRQQTGLTADSDKRFDDSMKHANAQMDAIQAKIKSDAAAAKAKRDARAKCVELKANADMDGYRNCMQDLPK